MSTVTDLLLEDPHWEEAIDDIADWVPKVVEAAVAQTALPSQVKESEVSINCADDAAIQRLNHAFRGKDAPTNVLSFPAQNLEINIYNALDNEDNAYLGDIIVAYPYCAKEAKAQNKPLKDHLAHMVVHGVLHLLGHDHIDDDDAKMMEALEIKALEGLGVKNPYAIR